MKKLFFCSTIFFLLTTFGLQAQAVKSIALKPGLAIAKQCWNFKNGDDDSDSENLLGFTIAANAEFLENKFFSILAEVGYTPKGFNEEVDVSTQELPEGTGETKTFTTHFNYLYLAPMFKARMEFGKFVPYVFTGPRIDFEVSYSSDFDLSYLEKDFNKIIFGMIYGVGLEYLFGNIGVGIVYQQQLDFSKVYSEEATMDQAGLDIMNNAYIVDLAVKYYFGKK
jgi:hypothetical protein